MKEQMAIDIVRKEKAYMDSHAGKAQSEAFDMAIKALEEIQQYRALGTVEELRVARDKQVAVKPRGIDRDICPNCSTFNSIIPKRRNAVGSDTIYCWHCGKAIEI